MDCNPRYDWAPEKVVLDSALQCQPYGKCKQVILSPKQQVRLHDMYLERSLGSTTGDARLGQLRQLWDKYQAHLRSLPSAEQRAAGFYLMGRDRKLTWRSAQSRVTAIFNFEEFVNRLRPTATSEQRAIVKRMIFSVKYYSSAKLGSVKLKVGSWFLARPSFLNEHDSKRMWFGKVERIFTHFGPNLESNLILEVTYYDYMACLPACLLVHTPRYPHACR